MSSLLELQQLEPDLYQASFDLVISTVHIFVIDDPRDGLIVIDSSAPAPEGTENPIAQVLRELGRKPEDVRHVLLTHAHPDHIGNVGDFQKLSGATVWMNPLGARILESERPALPPVNIRGGGVRDKKPVLARATVHHKITDGQRIDLAGGIEVLDTHGHSADHQSFLWHRHGGVLFVGDAVTNENGEMGFAPFYDDLDEERRSVEKLQRYAFEKMAFGHGDYIPRRAKEKFIQRWQQQ
ncbi:hypothetical protein DEIPH_ctg019orf0030 [Deinococcus phoenicis]|uniref:Metallo-beta-lactamase domain-containing protein n=1 Tax=Deinococcus phoenicis TaxID=1476583 RepID=A0A016QR65_9DEIO|nr:MBL fold metallo-hydrolase [Deinococcus phoenicis]EYB68615.1 hypothetical protein DEIPH_ctg019orf0030 [Deinococcus phoenicis]